MTCHNPTRRHLSQYLMMFGLTLLSPLQAAQAAATIQVQDAHGRMQALPAKPQRILALSELDLDTALALGIKPVGAANGRGQQHLPQYLGAAAKDIPSVGNFAQPLLERVLQRQPDVILAGGIPDPELLAQLGKIAPVFVSFRPGEAWTVALNRIASALQQESAAQRFHQQYQQKIQSLRQRLGNQAGATVSVVRWNPQGPSYMQRDAFASLVLADVKLQRPRSQQQPGAAHSQPLSQEAMAQIDADWLLIGTLDGPQGQANRALQAARQSPAFRQLGAVQKDRLRAVDGALWTSPGGPLAALAILHDLEKILTPQQP